MPGATKAILGIRPRKLCFHLDLYFVTAFVHLFIATVANHAYTEVDICESKQQSIMNRNELSFLHLLDWIEGRLSGRDALLVAEAVAQADEEIQTLVRWMRAFQKVSARTVLTTLPRNHRNALIRQFREHADDQKKPGLYQRFLATLSFDSGLRSATAGVRATSSLGNQRQIICSTAVADVVINTQPGEGGSQLDMLGQVMQTEAGVGADFVVQLLRDDDGRETEFQITCSDEIGEFSFQTIPPGTYKIVVSTEHMEIQTPQIELKLNT